MPVSHGHFNNLTNSIFFSKGQVMNKLLKLATLSVLLVVFCVCGANAKRHFGPVQHNGGYDTFKTVNGGTIEGYYTSWVTWTDDETGETGIRYIFEDSNRGPGYVDSITDRNGHWEGNYWTPTPLYPRNTILSEYGEPQFEIRQSNNMNEIQIIKIIECGNQYSVHIYDLNGYDMRVSSVESSNDITINTSELPNGAYFIVITDEQRSYNSKFMISR